MKVFLQVHAVKYMQFLWFHADMYFDYAKRKLFFNCVFKMHKMLAIKLGLVKNFHQLQITFPLLTFLSPHVINTKCIIEMHNCPVMPVYKILHTVSEKMK